MNLTSRIVAGIAMLLAVLVGASGAAAATYNVTRTDDPDNTHGACAAAGPCSLREALNTVNDQPSPPDVVMVPAGSYTLASSGLVIT
jgi:CSLREA domain-containing protein